MVVVLLVREENSRRDTGWGDHKTTAGIGLLEEWGWLRGELPAWMGGGRLFRVIMAD